MPSSAALRHQGSNLWRDRKPAQPIHAGLVDVMSLKALRAFDALDVAFAGVSAQQYAARRAVLTEPAYRDERLCLQLLEQLVISDRMYYDEFALAAAQVRLPAPLVGLYEPLRVTDEQYRRTSVIADELRQQYYNERLDRDDRFRDSGLEDLHDLYLKLKGVTVVDPTLANTNDGIGRALFYLQLAKEFGLHAVLTSKKARWLREMNREVPKDVAHETVAATVRGALRDAQADVVDVAYGGQLSISAAPVAEMLIRKSQRTGRRVSDVALELRETARARAYRRKLAALSTALWLDRLSDRLAVRAAVREVDEAVHTWVEEEDRGAGVLYKRRTLSFAWLGRLVGAAAGAVAAAGGVDPGSASAWIDGLEALCEGLGEVSVKDKILVPKRSTLYLGLIAEFQ